MPLQQPPNLHYVPVYDSFEFGAPILPDRLPDSQCLSQVEEIPLVETLEDSPDEIEEEVLPEEIPEIPQEEKPAVVEIPEENCEEIPQNQKPVEEVEIPEEKPEEIPQEEKPAEEVEIVEEKPEEIPEIPQEEKPAEEVEIVEEKPEEIPQEEKPAEVEIPEEKLEEIPQEEKPAEEVEIPEEKPEEIPQEEKPAEEEIPEEMLGDEDEDEEAHAELLGKINGLKSRLQKMDETDFRNRMVQAQTHPKFPLYVLEMHKTEHLEDEVDLLAYWEVWLGFYEEELQRIEANKVKEEVEEEVEEEPVLRNSDQRRLRQQKQNQNRDKSQGKKKGEVKNGKEEPNKGKKRQLPEQEVQGPNDAAEEVPKDAVEEEPNKGKKRQLQLVEKSDQETYKKLLSHTLNGVSWFP